MSPRPNVETIESLRLTLQKLQQTSETAQDVASMADLKAILLNRIAELEVTLALSPADAETETPSNPAALIPPSVTEEAIPQESAPSSELAKLD